MTLPLHPWALHPGLTMSEALRAAGLSKAEAARRLSVSPAHLCRVLGGHAMPSADLTIRFGNLVGVSPWLLWRMRADYELDRALGAPDVTHWRQLDDDVEPAS